MKTELLDILLVTVITLVWFAILSSAAPPLEHKHLKGGDPQTIESN